MSLKEIFKFEYIFVNPDIHDIMNIDHVRDKIFSCLDSKTLDICVQVCRAWRIWFEKLACIKFLYEFGNYILTTNGEGEALRIKTIHPGWDNAVKKFVKISSLKELKEVKNSFRRRFPSGLVRLPFANIYILACEQVHMTMVDMILKLSTSIIDINGRQDPGFSRTALMVVCIEGHVQTAALMTENQMKLVMISIPELVMADDAVPPDFDTDIESVSVPERTAKCSICRIL